MKVNAPQLLVLSYYDGATEGFVDGLESDQVYFFKVVAWDQTQDKRLYVLGLADRALYLEILKILGCVHPPTKGIAWTPAWTFTDSESEARANEIVEIGKRSLRSPACLMLGVDLTSSIKLASVSPRGLASAIALADKSMPGDLSDWLALAP